MIPHEIHGLPVHPLAVHASVVLVPLSALLAILFVIPRTRRWASLPMPLVAFAALASLFVSRASGYNLKSHLASFGGSTFASSILGKDIQNHQSKANWLCVLMLFFALITVAVYLLWLSPGWLPGNLRFVGTVQYVACAVLIVGAAVVAFQTYRTGEAGTKILYNPDGSQNFSSSARLLTHP